ncbi:hypothetical protein TEA_005888 [Camellia sinensis var. sinensis]|uniref:Uncharacterized protein n=1 Tax=Camellia sinensis var. sinensis TaxID=542762 RepID=A0A4S4E6J6_CAMSN|nr:hypothetical protein TEA_005888 [Camellia sinensis var. sinensis]
MMGKRDGEVPLSPVGTVFSNLHQSWDCRRGLRDSLSRIANNERNLWHRLDAVAASHDEGGNGGGGDGGGDGVAVLVDGDAAVPAVARSSSERTCGRRDTWFRRHLGDGVGLATVLGHVGVDEGDDIWADRGLHDVRQGEGVGGAGGDYVGVEVVDGDPRAGRGQCWWRRQDG